MKYVEEPSNLGLPCLVGMLGTDLGLRRLATDLGEGLLGHWAETTLPMGGLRFRKLSGRLCLGSARRRTAAASAMMRWEEHGLTAVVSRPKRLSEPSHEDTSDKLTPGTVHKVADLGPSQMSVS